MRSTLSWKWLVPRFISRNLRKAPSGTRATGRPCLALERLEQRNLLTANSAEPASAASESPPLGADTQVLVDLIQGGIKVTQDEFKLLSTLADGPPGHAEAKVKIHDISVIKVVDKATPLLLRLNDTLIKVGEQVIKGELTEKKVHEAENKIEYLKIKLEDILISSFHTSKEAADEILNPLFANADALVDEMVSQRKAGKGQQEFIRLAADILKMEDLAIKGELDFLKHGTPGLDVGDFQVKIERVFQKAEEAVIKLKLDETDTAALKSALVDFEGGIKTLLDGLGDGIHPEPGGLGANGKFTGGIFIPPTDDTIT